MGVNGLCWALMGSIGLYWAVLGCTGLYWAVLGCLVCLVSLVCFSALCSASLDGFSVLLSFMSIIAIVDADEDLSVTLASDDSILSKSSESGFAEINQFDHLGRSAEKKGWFFSTMCFQMYPQSLA